MKRGLDWYKRDPIAFLDGVQGMGAELIGAYAVLIDLMYARGGDTKRDDRHLAGLLGCSTRKATALTEKLIEMGKISALQDGFITNSRVETDARRARDDHEARVRRSRNAGEKSGEVRKNKDLGEQRVQTPTNREEKRREEKKDTPLTPQGGEGERPVFDGPSFDDFWLAYPRRSRENGTVVKPGRAKAESVWKRLNADERQAAINGLGPWKRSYPDGDRYVCDAERYLKNRRWTDETFDVRPPSVTRLDLSAARKAMVK